MIQARRTKKGELYINHGDRKKFLMAPLNVSKGKYEENSRPIQLTNSLTDIMSGRVSDKMGSTSPLFPLSPILVQNTSSHTTSTSRWLVVSLTRDTIATIHMNNHGFRILSVENQSPWKVSDAPERYIAIMQKNIIGVEVNITDLGDKVK